MEIKHIVFYGTLMSGGNTKLHERMKSGLVYVANCSFPGSLYDLGRYPGLKPNSRATCYGELYRIIDKELLLLLDEFEAIDNEDASKPGFTRKYVKLVDPNVEAWIYYYNGEVTESDLLETGRWPY